MESWWKNMDKYNNYKYQRLIEKHPYIEKALNKEDNEVKIYKDKSFMGENIYAIEKNGHKYYLNSRYDCNRESQIIMENLNANKNEFALIFIFGIGNGILIKKLLEAFPENYIYIHEPSIEYFKFLVENEENIDLLLEEHIILTVGAENNGARVELFHELLDESNYYLTDLICMPQYEFLMQKEYLEYIRSFHSRCEQIIMQKNTYLCFNQEHIDNFWKNIIDMIKQHGVEDLKLELNREDNEEYPAFIVSAGPSLDKNIDELKNIKGRGVIMAVDTAIKPLLKKGIVPDIIASVDPHKPLELFEIEGVQNIPMLVDIDYNYRISKIHKGKRFYSWSGLEFGKKIMGENFYKLGIIESGGSVACNLFSLAVRSGFKTIVLIGQDLAYPNGRGHSSASYDNENKIDINNKRYFEVEDIYGNRVLTETNMNAYRKWFEEYISRHLDVRYIDATEGGAKISGTEIKSLKDTIEECCSGLQPKEWQRIINKCPRLLTEQQKNDILLKIKNLPKMIDETENMIEESDKTIKGIKRALRNGDLYFVKKSIQKIIDINNKLDGRLDVSLLNMYNVKESYEVSMGAYRLEDKQNDDIKSIIKLCETSNNGYKEAIRKARKDLNEKLKEIG